jgi:hypothetical protein
VIAVVVRVPVAVAVDDCTHGFLLIAPVGDHGGDLAACFLSLTHLL